MVTKTYLALLIPLGLIAYCIPWPKIYPGGATYGQFLFWTFVTFGLFAVWWEKVTDARKRHEAFAEELAKKRQAQDVKN